MQTHFAISIISFFVLFLAGVAIARHIRSTHKLIKKIPQRHRDFAHHLISAVKGQNPNPSRTVAEQTLKQLMANKSRNKPSEMVTLRPDSELQTVYERDSYRAVTEAHKASQSSFLVGVKCFDSAYFDNNLGDLTEPYQTPRFRAISRDKSFSPNRF